MQPYEGRHMLLRDALIGQVLRGSAGTSYYLRERIGEGGQGWVFKANWDEPGGIVVIVKVLRPDAIQADALPRFRREAEVLRMLSQQARPNPYIVRFYDHAVAELRMPGGPMSGDGVSLPFTVLEYVPGPTLEKVLSSQRGRGLSVERVRRLARQTEQALELVHQQHIVHRDLKPSNILLATEGEAEVAKITDFGIVKRADMNLQRTTTLAGASLGYAPPEQYEQGNDRVTPKTDIFSFAAILFEMLSGQMAFPFSERENPLLIVTRILNGPRPELGRVRHQLAPELASRPEIIKELDGHIGRALRADPADRPASVTEFWGRLEPLLRDVSTVGSDAPSSMLPFASTEASPARPGSQPDTATQRSSSPRMSPAPSPPVRINPVVAQAPAAFSPSAEAPRGAPPRPRAPDPIANPAAWAWRLVSRPIQERLVRAAAFLPGGDSVIGVGPAGLARWLRGTWSGFNLPPGIDARAVRGVRVAPDGDLILFGVQSLAARLSTRGALDLWSSPARDVTLNGAFYLDGACTLVGERPLRPSSPDVVAAALHFVQGRFVAAMDAPNVPRLHGVTQLERGPILAVGDKGALARIEPRDKGTLELVSTICRGHLVAIEAIDGGAVTVGGGGHALHVSARLEAQLEAVQTTRDLSALTIGPGGAAWAGAAQARLLRREGDSWVRMSGDLGVSSRIVAIWAHDPIVRAVCDDGAVLEGRAS